MSDMDKKVYTTEADFTLMPNDKSDADEYLDFHELLFAKDWGKIPNAGDTIRKVMAGFHNFVHTEYPELTGSGTVSVKTPQMLKAHRLWSAIETIAYASDDVHNDLYAALNAANSREALVELSSKYSKKLREVDVL